MITCTTSERIARQELARAEHAGHAAVIRHATITDTDTDALLRWTTVHESPADALAELDRIADGRGNYLRDRMTEIEIGPVFHLLRNHVL